MRNLEKNRGITLIALVVTIIVLLILAGISISMLTGENGILIRAGEAKEETDRSQIIEKARLDIMEVQTGNSGNIKEKELKDILNKYGEVSGKGEDQILKPTGKDYTIKVSEIYNGVVDDDLVTAKEIAANPKEYYGKKVINYKASEDDTNVYRIFYVDKADDFKDGAYTIYLKADYSSTTYNLNKYATYDAEYTKVREMNPDWATHRGNSSWNENEQGAAYLCSPVDSSTYSSTELPWKEYYKSNDTNVNYVIGGPSVEMYVKSYNQAYEGINESNIYTLGAKYRDTYTPGYIYTLNGKQSTISNSDHWTGDDSLDYNSMYCGKRDYGNGYWWLASPSAYGSDYGCRVNGSSAYLGNYRYNFGNGGALSPLVSLKSSFRLEVEKQAEE